ncbi:DUF1835 domain-containing protein [Mesonia sp. K7]|uniref:DUF1835 domain-containing protein n=1 Tax=Mesonia sp. K7 TaxID=2218606 RepID=UPI000DAA9A43|nr:DUF1835 domain-containing protein [Mesonia sp. K7]PZD79196.1 DUF1835 domain-containing protein [Mesonia sp. K7]
MEDKILHIINGDAALPYVQALNLGGEYFVWREMLCVGPSKMHLLHPEFESIRKNFLTSYYQLEVQDYGDKFIEPLKKLQHLNQETRVVLWFEDDLYCYINMLAAIQFLLDIKLDKDISLVAVGSNSEKTTPITSLSQKQLEKFYKKRVRLTLDDIEYASLVWSVYCESNPLKIKILSEIKSSFKYLPELLKLHLKRYPGATTGLNALEKELLNLIDTNKVASQEQWLQLAIDLPHKYGFSDVQLNKIISKLTQFTTSKNKNLVLNENGLKVKNKTQNFYRDMKDEMKFGGSEKYQFLYIAEQGKLMKL